MAQSTLSSITQSTSSPWDMRVTAEQESAVLHRNLHQEPLHIARAEGNSIVLDNGRKIFDATGGAAVSCLGHGNQRVKAAITRQLDQISYCHTSFFTVPSAEELGKELIHSTEGKMGRAFIVSSGSEAMEAAMKMTRQYFIEIKQPQRTKFIARRQSYHGATLGALSLGGHVQRRAAYEPMLLPNISMISPCNAYRGLEAGETIDKYVDRLAQELDEEFGRQGPDTVCAFVVEPVVGAALGCVPSVPGYLQAVKDICSKHGALLILDEIMCGMGRTGYMHAWQQENVIPDLQTIGKALGGGFVPVAGLLIGHGVIDVLKRGTGAFAHGQTYQGHPIACAAALEVQRIIREDNLLPNVRAMGKLMEELLWHRLGSHENVGDIRGRGLFWGVELVRDKETKEPFDPELGIATAINSKGLSPPYGISIYPGNGTVDGTSGDHVLLAPAFNVDESEIRMIVDRTAQVIEDYFEEFFRVHVRGIEVDRIS